MWEAMDTRVTERQEGAQWTVRQLSQKIREVLSTDWKRQAEEAGCTIEYLLASEPPFFREAWVRMWRWYRDASNRHPPPARVSLETLTEEHAELHAHVPPPGRPIPIEVSPFPVDDDILGGEDIAETLLRL